MKLLLITTILSVCSAAAVPDDPELFYAASCRRAFDEPLLDDSGTQHVCQIFEGLSCPLGCVISGKRSVDIITRGRWDLECGLSSQIQEYDAEIDAKREASCF